MVQVLNSYHKLFEVADKLTAANNSVHCERHIRTTAEENL